MTEEVTLNTENLEEKNRNSRRFYAIKNQRGEYLSYNYGYLFTDKINNAKVYCTKERAIQQAINILETKKSNPKIYASVEKVYVQELMYKEI